MSENGGFHATSGEGPLDIMAYPGGPTDIFCGSCGGKLPYDEQPFMRVVASQGGIRVWNFDNHVVHDCRQGFFWRRRKAKR